MLDAEIEKYRRLGRAEIVDWYESWRRLPERGCADADRIAQIAAAIDAFDGAGLPLNGR